MPGESESAILHQVIGSGWYRQLFFLALSVAVLAVAATGGADVAPVVGLVVAALGVVALAVYASPWFEKEWPLDGKDGWLIAGGVLTTVGLLVAAAGLLL